MQNKTAIWVFTVLLTLACLYQLSFSYFTAQMEDRAQRFGEEKAARKVDSLRNQGMEFEQYEVDSLEILYKRRYLDRNGSEEVYPIFGHTYDECKQRALSLGLDLQGGMSVTLQVSLERFVNKLTGNPKDGAFQAALDSASRAYRLKDADFFEVLLKEFEKRAPQAQLAAVVQNRENQGLFEPEDPSQNIMTNRQVIETMREKRRQAVKNTERILRERIDRFGVTNPSIQKQGLTGRFIVELPGVKDKNRVRDYLRSTANLGFWKTFGNQVVGPDLQRADRALREALYPNFEPADTAGEVAPDTSSPSVGDTASSADTISSDQGDEESDTVDRKEKILEGIGEGADTAEKEGGETVSAPDTAKNAKKKNPLFSVLRPNVQRNEQTGQMSLRSGPIVGFAKASDTARVNELLKHPAAASIFDRRLRFMWSAEAVQDNVIRLYAIKVDDDEGGAAIDGKHVTQASQDFDRNGNVQVNMQMDAKGANDWANLTGNLARKGQQTGRQRAVAIVMDNEVYSAPVVNEKIPNGNSRITMGGGDKAENLTEGQDLSNLLNAGSLPAPLNIVEESVVGPSLGKENINSGLMSFAIALVVVLVYMVAYYHGAGIVSDLALVANLFFLLGALASLQASLTLPGIAGIVLTIGIAVDANVLIYDRVREELNKGKALNPAISEGYRKAYAAIVDANITTLLTAIILATFGSGPIRGFATTLIIGIFSSLFAAIFITRLIFTNRLDKKLSITFATKWTKNAFSNMKVRFLRGRKLAYVISSLVVLAGIVSFFTKGFNLGVEFTGGRTYKVRFEGNAGVNELKSSLGEQFVTEDGRKMVPEVKTFGGGNQVKVTTNYRLDDKGEGVDEAIKAKLLTGMKQSVDNPRVLGSRKVDPTISQDIKVSAFWAVIFAVTVIFLYILIRFQKWQYGLGALLAIFHDVVVVLACFSIFYGLLPFTLEIDQAFIAAILTVVGYSINDTVVVYDRIREYLREHHKHEPLGVIERAMNSTIGRTFNTSMTTFSVLLMIFLFGSETIQGFAFALMVGVVVGTYSSLFIATPFTVDLTKAWHQESKEKKKKEVTAAG